MYMQSCYRNRIQSEHWRAVPLARTGEHHSAVGTIKLFCMDWHLHLQNFLSVSTQSYKAFIEHLIDEKGGHTTIYLLIVWWLVDPPSRLHFPLCTLAWCDRKGRHACMPLGFNWLVSPPPHIIIAWTDLFWLGRKEGYACNHACAVKP